MLSTSCSERAAAKLTEALPSQAVPLANVDTEPARPGATTVRLATTAATPVAGTAPCPAIDTLVSDAGANGCVARLSKARWNGIGRKAPATVGVPPA